ncbi:hypothetical protein Pint_32761 [Pistacia integerrima]|uniref:Uncharacterized protein n=1 Tax=Pistacia integerrima TaxID=434235 RepID=A0ACC0XN21_9ROSI|nr:hypothetical protein Pint_32761 [Pistacia integerrima]
MAAAHRSINFLVIFILSLFSLALAQDENQFIYHGFSETKLDLDGIAKIHSNGLLQLTNTSELKIGHAFYPFPFKFNISSPQSLSFSTTFVFGIVSKTLNFGGNGMSFFILPSKNMREAVAGPYLGLFNLSNNGLPTNHILAVELDTVQSSEVKDINGNHVGVDVNSLQSNESAAATYFSNKEGKNIGLQLAGGDPIQIWIDYNGADKFLNVTLAPLGIPKPNRPLLSTPIDLSKILLDSMYVGLSASTGTRVSDQYILGWSFNRSGQAQNLDISKLPQSPSPPKNGSNKVLDRATVVSLIATVVVLITIGAAVYIVRKKKYEEVNEDWEKEYGPHRISYKNLYKATKGFKDKELIGQGGFGKVYRGALPPSNLQIAVKRVTHDSVGGMRQFVAEIVLMRRLRHRNLLLKTGKATTSTDVFAFGAFMLEVACGRRPMAMEPGEKDLVDWVTDFLKRGAIIDASDPRLEGIYVEKEMELVLKLGLYCSDSNPETRPSMKQVIQYLDGGTMLPNTPPGSIVIGEFTTRNEPPDNVVSFHSLVGSSSYTTTTNDSNLTVGR